MFNFKTNRSVVALDIGESSVKAVELAVSAERPALLRAGIEEMALLSDAEKENPEVRDQRFAHAITRLLKRLNLSPQKIHTCVSALPGNKVSIKQIKSMPLSTDELASSLYFEARKHVPVEGEVLMDYQVLQETPAELDLLLCVTAKESVKSHLALLARCGIRGPVIDAPALAVVNGWLLHPETDVSPDTVLFLNLGASITHLAIYRKKGLFFVREIPSAGNHFTREMAGKFNLGLSEAEMLKRQKGALHLPDGAAGAGEEQKLGFADADNVRHVAMESLVREILRSIRFYAKETGHSQIDLCVLSGGGACDAALVAHLESSLRLQCKIFDPFRGLPLKTELPSKGREQFTQAMGMAFRGVHDLLQNQPQ